MRFPVAASWAPTSTVTPICMKGFLHVVIGLDLRAGAGLATVLPRSEQHSHCRVAGASAEGCAPWREPRGGHLGYVGAGKLGGGTSWNQKEPERRRRQRYMLVSEARPGSGPRGAGCASVGVSESRVLGTCARHRWGRHTCRRGLGCLQGRPHGSQEGPTDTVCCPHFWGLGTRRACKGPPHKTPHSQEPDVCSSV